MSYPESGSIPRNNISVNDLRLSYVNNGHNKRIPEGDEIFEWREGDSRDISETEIKFSDFYYVSFNDGTYYDPSSGPLSIRNTFTEKEFGTRR